MWDRWKNVIVGRPPATRPVRAAARHLDLCAFPALPVGDPNGLSAVNPLVLAGYLGYPVVRVEQLDHDPTPSPVPRQPSRRTGDHGWCLLFESGSAMSVQVHRVDDARAFFPILRSRYLADRGGTGGSPQGEDLTLSTVCAVPNAPYETYYRGTLLASRRRVHEAVVTTGAPSGPLVYQRMAGVAALALRMICD